MLIDTHTHLDDARYNDDREAMIARAREAGVEAFVTIGCDLATSQAAVALAEQHPFLYASIGVHPHEVKHILDSWYDEFRRLAQNTKVVPMARSVSITTTIIRRRRNSVSDSANRSNSHAN